MAPGEARGASIAVELVALLPEALLRPEDVLLLLVDLVLDFALPGDQARDGWPGEEGEGFQRSVFEVEVLVWVVRPGYATGKGWRRGRDVSVSKKRNMGRV